MSEPFSIEAPAKVNLRLRVIGRRDDGFHEVETLMTRVHGLADRLVFEPAAGYELACVASGVPLDDSNLVTKAVRRFQEETGKACAWRVTLEKRVPHGAGLGGGSSDAASTLLALDRLEGTALGTDRLAAMAGELGSDVAFFVSGQTCLCRGRGEIVEPVACGLRRQILLLKPAFGVSTPDAYGRWLGSRELPGIDYGPQVVDGVELFNDLERPVFSKHLFLAEVKLWLQSQKGVDAALMSGSGSTMFALLADGVGGDEILGGARRELDPTVWGGVFEVGGDATFL